MNLKNKLSDAELFGDIGNSIYPFLEPLLEKVYWLGYSDCADNYKATREKLKKIKELAND